MSKSQTHHSQSEVILKSVIFGPLTAMVSLPFEHPFDALKTNMQSDQGKLLPTAKQMFRRKGWKAFYNGFSMNFFRVAIKQALRWPLWISLSSFYKKILPHSHQVIKQTATGFSIAFCELLTLCPFERVKIWLMTTQTQQQTKITNYYRNYFNFRDLYRGFISLLIRQGLSWSSFLASSQIFKNMMKEYRNSEIMSSTDLFLISIPVAIINTIAIMPIDCIKTFQQKFQREHIQMSILGVMADSYRKYGIRGLYLGWSARIIQYNIQSAFTLIVIQDLHRQYQAVGKS